MIRRSIFTTQTIKKHLVDAQYNVHQGIDKEGDHIRDEIFSENHNFTFDQITNLNLGNPQRDGASTFISFNRDVLSAIMNPKLLKMNVFSPDVIRRTEELLQCMGSPVGAYTSDSRGYKFSRQKIAEFIERRDGIKADANKIYMTNGASEAAKMAISFLVRDENDGILLPTPNYPLYGAKLKIVGGTPIDYPLTEGEHWTIDPARVEKRIVKAQKDKLNIRAMVVVNPGNPTGHVLAQENIQQIIELCYKHSILIVADEVYQDNIHTKKRPFVSFRKVLDSMPVEIRDSVELLSLDSVSKGMNGESGLRGGYIETHNIDDDIEKLMYKLRSMNLCSNTIGQIAVTLYADPPKEGRESDETVEKYRQQIFKIRDGYRQRASIIHNVLDEMEGVTCTPFEGSMYTFPRLHLPEKAIQSASDRGMNPDYYYSLKLLRETGIQVVPG